jgi:hypothetical protein
MHGCNNKYIKIDEWKATEIEKVARVRVGLKKRPSEMESLIFKFMNLS